MKTIKSILKAACVALIAASCTNEIDNSVKVSQLFEAYFAETAPETRVVIDSELKAVTWEFTDNIAIFDAGYTAPVKANVSSIADGGKKAIFAPTSAVINPAYALHPYQAAATVEGNVVSAIVPGAALGTLTESCMAVSKADDGKFAFKSVAGIFQFTVSDPNVKSVVIKGAGIAGGIKATVDAGSVTVAPYGTPDNEIEVPEIAPDQVCYVAVVPKEYDGLTFIYKDKNGAELGKTVCTDKVQVNAGDILTWGDFAKLQKAYLPTGSDFNKALSTVAGGNLANITNIAFMTGYKPAGTVINEGTEGAPIGVEFSNGTVFICTPANVFVANENSQKMFYGCNAVKTISGLDKWNTDGVKYMNQMFYQCFEMTYVDVSHFNTTNVTNMSYMFYECHKLESVNVTGFNTSKVTNMCAMFYECRALKSLDLSKFDTSNVTDMQAMLDYLDNLETLDLSNFNTAKVTNMKYTIKSCPKLKTLTLGANFKIPSTNTELFTELGTSNSTPYTTFYCDINQWNTVSSLIGSTNIGNYRWGNAPADAQLPKGSDFNTAVANAAGGVSNVKTITFETYSTKTGTRINDGLGDTPVYVSNSSGNVTVSTQAAGFKANANCREMFNKLSALTAINNMDLVSTSDVTTMYLMFGHCGKLASVDLSKFDTRNVTDLFAMFYQDFVLTSVNLSSFNTAKVTDMASMFLGCSALTSLDLSSFSTPVNTRTSYMFDGCTALKSITFGSNFKCEKVNSMYMMFMDCTSLTSLDLSNFNTANVTSMQKMFYNCTVLGTLKLGSNFTTAKVTNMERMFWHCKALTSLDLSKFNTANVTDMEAMFCYASSLTALYISNFNTAKVTKMDSLWANTSHLATIKLGADFKIPSPTPSKASWNIGSSNSPVRATFDCPYEQWLSFVAMRKKDGYNPTDYRWKNVPTAAPLPAGTDFNKALKTAAGDLANIKTITFTPESYIANGTLVSTGTSPVYINYSSGNITIYTPSSEFSTTSCKEYFRDCSAMTTINGLTKLNTANSTSMYYMFTSCNALTSIDLSKFNTEKVELFDNMFWHCDAVTSLDLSTFSSASAGSVRAMFSRMANVTSIKFGSNFTIAKATITDYMFYYCEKLSALDLSNFNTSKVTSMTYMFANTPVLATITLGSNFKFSATAESVNNIFTGLGTSNTSPYTTFYCDYQQWRVIAANVPNVSGYKWGNPPTSAPLPKGTDFNTAMKNLAGGNLANIKTIQFNKGNTSGNYRGTVINRNESGAPIYGYYSSGIINLYTASGQYMANEDCSKMFKDMTAIEHIYNLAYHVSTENTTDMSYMFNSCTKLATLNLTESASKTTFKTDKVTNMSFMFQNCEVLTSLDLSLFNTAKVTNMESMFEYCYKLESLDLKKFVTNSVQNFNYMFSRCKSIKTLDVSYFNTSSAKEMQSMFSTMTSVTSINFGGMIAASVTNMSYMFYKCENLESLTLNNFNTAKVTTFISMFEGTAKLSLLKLGNNFVINTSAYTADMIHGLGASNSGTYKADIYSNSSARGVLMSIYDSDLKYRWYSI